LQDAFEEKTVKKIYEKFEEDDENQNVKEDARSKWERDYEASK